MIQTTRPEEEAPNPSSVLAEGVNSEKSIRGWILLWCSFVFAFLQSVCTAVIAVSGIRVAIGVSALVSANWIAIPDRFHVNWIRIPMMVFALAGSLLNLYVIRRVRRLRSRPAAQWRMQPVANDKLSSESLQIFLAAVTLVLLAAEETSHIILHRVL